MNLWLDDVRPMPEGFDIHVKTAQEAIDILKSVNVEFISFDHDLGESENGTGYDVANWIDEQVVNGEFCVPDWKVHSSNPVGKNRINAAMNHAEHINAGDYKYED